MNAFLDAGAPPVYMGFGSITCHSPKFMTLLCLRAAKLGGVRAVLVSGWAGLSMDHTFGEHDEHELRAFCNGHVLFMEAAPHECLFSRCSVLVHHGGAGTLAAALRSGMPSVILPVIIDQFPHAELVTQRGVGVGLPSMAKVSPAEVASALLECLSSQDIRRSARELADTLRSEDGQSRLVEEVGSYLSEVLNGRHMAIAN